MIFEITAIVSVIIFLVLAIYIIITLKELQKTLIALKSTIVTLDSELVSLKVELSNFLSNSTTLVGSVNKKLNDLDPLFNTVSNVGVKLNNLTNSFDTYKARKEELKNMYWQEKICDAIDMAEIGVKLYQQFRKRR